jgi:hypothetical protein
LRAIGRDLRRENPNDVAAGLAKEQRLLRLGLERPQFKGKEFERMVLGFTLAYYDKVEQSVAEGIYHDVATALELLPDVLETKLGKLHLTPDSTLTER